LAARIVCQYAQADWIFDFICEVYQANFVYGQNISQTETIENILKKLQLDSQSIIEMSTTEPAKQALKYNGLRRTITYFWFAFIYCEW
jgi:2-hydroxychromene-2-carboxylate isomerase